MERTALAVCEILRYLMIHWKCEAGVSEGALLEGLLRISIDTGSPKHLPEALHCEITIASTGSIYSGLVFKKVLQGIQPVLPRFSAKLTWASEEGSHSQDTSGRTPFQMIFKIDENPQSLMTDCLVIKHFLRKITIVHHKLKINFSLTVNGILSAEIFGAENEPTLRLSNGITLVVGFQHYVSKPKSNPTESYCSRIHPVLGHPALLFIPAGMADSGLLGKLTLTPAAALCPSPKVFSSQLSRISSLYIFLYGPLGLPLISDQEQPSTTVFRDTSYFIDWKKHNLFMVPTLDLNLDTDLVLPDVSYEVESNEGVQSQGTDSQGPALLLFLFVDLHSGSPVQQVEVWGLHTLLTAHLSAILSQSRSTVQESIQSAVDQALERHHQAAQVHQRLKGPLSVAVNSIMSVLTGSTCSSFRKTCLQALEAADTQEFRTKLHRIFYDTTQHRLLHHCSCDTEQNRIKEKNTLQDGSETWPDIQSQPEEGRLSGPAQEECAKRPAGKQKTRDSREAPTRAGKNRKLCAFQSPPHATTSPLWPPPMPEDRRPKRSTAGLRRLTQQALPATWRYRGERRAGAGHGCCSWVLTTVSSAPAGLVAARSLQSVRVAESGTQVLIARY
ncbi:type 2 DNA topoisomerase 6 subunit B-like isoform X2 [Sigmodon hispidus]